MKLKNKVAVITGAASGIGKEIAEVFANEGAKVVIADLNEEAATQVAFELNNKGLSAIGIGIGMNVCDEPEVNNGIKKIIETFGNIDILISNAGIQHIESLDKLPFSKWKQMLAVHLDGAFLLTKACLNNMYSHKNGGTIIYIGSVHSKEASLLKGPYVTAKHGLIGLCKVVAKEGAAYGVRSNVVCPGFVKTPLVEKQIPEQAKSLNMTKDEVIKKVMLKETVDSEFTTLEDVAKTTLFLAAFPTNALTGQSIVVSHGWFMQ